MRSMAVFATAIAVVVAATGGTIAAVWTAAASPTES